MQINKIQFKQSFETKMYSLYAQSINDATNEQLLNVLCSVIKDMLSKKWVDNKLDSQKEVYYFSIEFLLGRQLKSNLLNLGIEDEIREGLKELNIELDDLIKAEADPALGNGGLGRLAACFLDSMASLDISGHGYGIRYKHGLFEQKFVNGYQVEVPDNWLTQDSYVWETVRPNKAIVVKFEGNVSLYEKNGRLEVNHTDYVPIMAMPYDIPIIGYKNSSINTLRLFKSEVLNRDFGPLTKNAKNSYGSYDDALKYKYYAEEISQVLYPNDSNYAGRLLRLKQEYFFVSAGIQDIIRKYKKKNLDIRKLNEKVAIHINDTHPTLCIPELMRILLDEEHLSWDEAWDIAVNTISYTNHTIMTEAMERWPKDMLKHLLPRIYMIIEEINRRYVNELYSKNYDNDRIYRMSIIDNHDIKMANLSIVGSHSVNGVAELHSELLKKEVLKDFYEDEPEKFNNKTNGIAHRRWLISANKELSQLITELIGEDWKKDTNQLKNLEAYINDKDILEKIGKIKYNNKVRLANFIKENYNIDVNPNSIFDIQIKRLHAYKRQLLNCLHIIYLYQQIKSNPDFKLHPHTFIFGAKAAPSYMFAKNVIELINCLADKINNDPEVNKYIKVVFVENYDVSTSEILIPAADVSEQISLAGKEASGTGNMKFMMNGAITLGTLDGANVEIAQNVGNENCVIFGLTSNEVKTLKESGTYSALNVFAEDVDLRRAINSLMDGTWHHNNNEFRIIVDDLLYKNDEYLLLEDFQSYKAAHQKINNLYQDRLRWARMCLINIASSAFFSSDRTIKQYVEDIWKLDKVK